MEFGYLPQVIVFYFFICLVGAPYWVVSVTTERIMVLIIRRKLDKLIKQLAKKCGVTPEEYIKHLKETGEAPPQK